MTTVVLNDVKNNFSPEKWYFVTKIVLTYCEKKCSSDQEKILKFKAEGRDFAKILRSLEQFIQTVKGKNNFFTNLFLEVSQILKNRTIIIQTEKNYWDLEICRKS